MPERLSPAEIEVEATAICPHCRDGNQAMRRATSREFVHTWHSGGGFRQTICQANMLRLTGIKTNA